MDVDQFQKRLQWVEEERRKEKEAISMLENRMLTYEGGLNAINQQVKDLNGELARLQAVITRMDQYDQSLLQLRTESRKLLDELEKESKTRADETEKIRRVEYKSLEIALADLRKELEILPKYDKGIQASLEEDLRLRRTIEEVREKITEVRRDEEEYTRTFRLLEDGRRQDAKRLIDLQGEVTAIRKRVDDQRGQIELSGNSLRKLETRLNELTTVETERREAMSSFLDKQALSQVERERVWKDWQIRFESIEKKSIEVETQLQTLDTSQRDVKRAQTVLDELSAKVERRINEITEIQRLSEDRFRQEWTTFRADDQKRWTNYTLTQEEQRNEMLRRFEKLNDQGSQIEDELQEIKDILEQANEQAGKRLQNLLAMAHEWVTSYERSVGRSR